MACLASNNLRDIGMYVTKNKIELWTTADVLMKAVELRVITENRANHLWKKMCEDDVWLPKDTYDEYIEYIEEQKKIG